MQASELRVGNYLQGQKVVQVQSILGKNSVGIGYGDPYRVNTDDEFSPCLLPIKVTHERLIEMGFKYRYGVYIFDHDFELELQPCKEFLVALRDSYCEPLLYVHEIQNLFFALYRKELPCQLQ